MTASPLFIFLDFDGVTHPTFPRKGLSDADCQLFACVPRLEAVLRGLDDDWRIVVTSTWRFRESLAALKLHFSPDLRDRVVATTSLDGNLQEPGGRRKEVLAWLDAQAAGARFVVVDDFQELFLDTEQDGRAVPLVVCRDGFWPQEAQDLAEALRDPSGWAQAHPIVDRAGKERLVLTVDGGFPDEIPLARHAKP